MIAYPRCLCVLLVTLFAACGGYAEIQINVVEQQPGQTDPETTVPESSPLPFADGPEEDMLHLRNSDLLRGTLAGIHPDSGIHWQHPAVTDPIRFKLDSVNQIRLSRRQPADYKPGDTEILLSNGDRIPCTLVSLDAETVIVDTWYTGRMKIHRAMVNEIIPGLLGGQVVYQGPQDLASWTQGRSSNSTGWKLNDGILESSYQSTIGRDVEMPDMASIEFEMKWSTYPAFMVCLYTDNLQRYYGNCYSLTISGNSVYLQRYTQNGNSMNLGNFNVDSFTKKRQARFRLLVDKSKKSITLHGK